MNYKALGSTLLVIGSLLFSSQILPAQEGRTSNATPPTGVQDEVPAEEDSKSQEPKIETATFGAGCFWCVEAVYLRFEGVESVQSGYMGGYLENPTYQAVLTGQTGHAEVIQIKYDANKITFENLLEVLFEIHDPTTLNRQGNDIGTQYRSAIFCHDEEQKQLATDYIAKLTKEKKFRNKKIVTQVVSAPAFYVAEEYHQNYFERNPQNSYCRATIPSKLRKLERKFKDQLKEK